MSANTRKMSSFFDRATTALGTNRAACVHRTLALGPITPAIRAEVRKILTCSGHAAC
jgi:hypothetical protein